MAKAGEVSESTKWTIHGERIVDDSRRGKLSIAQVELPDGVQFEQYVLRLPKGAIVAVTRDRKVLMMWRHRFVIDRWVWGTARRLRRPQRGPRNHGRTRG